MYAAQSQNSAAILNNLNKLVTSSKEFYSCTHYSDTFNKAELMKSGFQSRLGHEESTKFVAMQNRAATTVPAPVTDVIYDITLIPFWCCIGAPTSKFHL